MMYRWRFGDENVVANLRRRWAAECRMFNDLELAHVYSEFSISDDHGDNDAKFPEWLAEGPIKEAPFKMQDIVSADIVELTIDDTGKLWLNVDGKCGFRIGKIDNAFVEAAGEKKQIYGQPVSNFHLDGSRETEIGAAAAFTRNRRLPVERRQTENDPHFAGSDRRMGTRRK